jgi:hypothetical protein
MAKRKPKPDPDPEPFSFSAWLARTSMMMVAGVLILAVTAVLFAKTEGFRSIVVREVEGQLGLKVAVGKSGLLWNGVVRLQDLRAAGEDTTRPYGVEIAEVHLRLSPFNLVRRGEASLLRSIDLRDCHATFSPDESGEMQPGRLSGISDWLARWGKLALPSTGDDPRRPSPIHPTVPEETGTGLAGPSMRWKRTRIAVHNAELRWLDAGGNTIVSVRDLDFTSVPVRFPTRDAIHIHLVAGLVELADGSQVSDMDVELLETGASYLVLNLEAVRRTGAAASPEPSPRRNADTPRVEQTPPAPAAADPRAERPEPEAAVAPESPAAPMDRAAFIRAELERAVAE